MSFVDDALNYECPKCGVGIGEPCYFDINEKGGKMYQDAAKIPNVSIVHAARFQLALRGKS